MVQIFKAWVNVFKGLTSDEDKRKASICGKCPKARYNKFIDFIDDELKEVKGMVCSDCGCPLIAKIRSTDKCKKW